MNSGRSYNLPTENIKALIALDEMIFRPGDAEIKELVAWVDKDLVEGSTRKSSLMSCSEVGAVERLKLILKSLVGPDKDKTILQERLQARTPSGYGILHFAVAARENTAQILSTLIENGLSVDCSGDKVHPLDVFDELVKFSESSSELRATDGFPNFIQAPPLEYILPQTLKTHWVNGISAETRAAVHAVLKRQE